MANFKQFPTAPGNARLDEPFLRELVKVINLTGSGKINCTGEFTCTANQASTIVKDISCSPNSTILLTPTTANAATEFGAGSLYVTSATGQFQVNHVNSATTGRTFRYAIIG